MINIDPQSAAALLRSLETGLDEQAIQLERIALAGRPADVIVANTFRRLALAVGAAAYIWQRLADETVEANDR